MLHTRWWRRLHGYQDKVMEADASLETDELEYQRNKVQMVQIYQWRQFRGFLQKAAPQLLKAYDQMALSEDIEDKIMDRAFRDEKTCDGELVSLCQIIELDKVHAAQIRDYLPTGEAA